MPTLAAVLTKPNPLIRQIESDFPGLYLLAPKRTERGPHEQFGVWRAGAIHVGDIMADGPFFTAEELRRKIEKLLCLS